MKIGYKAVKEGFKCRETVYDLEHVFYVKDDNELIKLSRSLFAEMNKSEQPTLNNNLKLCSNQGIHYCNNLLNVFTYYQKSDDVYEVEILGDYNDDTDKSITKALRFIRKVEQSEIDALWMHKALNLDKLQELMNKFPNLIIGGSLGLYLQGIKLKRVVQNGVGDFDLIHPYYINLQSEIGGYDTGETPSGNDFDSQVILGGLKMDLKVDPFAKYTIVEFGGYDYKVNDFRNIIEAKIKYSRKRGGEKHLDDLKELLCRN